MVVQTHCKVVEYNLSSSMLIRVGLCNSVPSIVIRDKKAESYLDQEEWNHITELSPKIMSYFEKRKKGNGEKQVRFKNIVNRVSLLLSVSMIFEMCKQHRG